MIPEHDWVKNPASAWRYAKNVIELYGDKVITEDRAMTKEVQNLLITIQNPLEGFPIEGSGWDMKALDVYADQFYDSGRHGFDYTYGERVHHKNQLAKVVDKLKDNNSTRRAVIKTWQPCRDYDHRHVPCLQLVEFLIRNNKLHMTCVFRSHDIGRAYVSNVYGLGKLQAFVAHELNIETGTLTTHSISAHIYVE